jgi:hypothetical protein
MIWNPLQEGDPSYGMQGMLMKHQGRSIINTTGGLVGGWAYPSEQYELVSWDYSSQYAIFRAWKMSETTQDFGDFHSRTVTLPEGNLFTT